MVGGLERVFEINRSFRNEGMSVRHNPEFTMIEFYEAFSDYERMMQMAEDIIRNASRTVNGTAKISYNGKEVDLESPFERLTILEAIKKYNPHYTDEQLNDAEWLKKKSSNTAKACRRLPASAACNSPCLKVAPRANCGTRPSSSITRSKFPRWHALPIPNKV